MKFSDRLTEDRRLVILRALTELPQHTANEAVLKTVLGHFGHRVGSDLVRADLHFLGAHGLVRKQELDVVSGTLWLATLTVAGEDVAEGRTEHPGVARRGAE